MTQTQSLDDVLRPGHLPPRAKDGRRLKILFVSQWYAPEPDGRVSSLASALAGRGHQVTVVTGFPNYPKGRLYEGYRLRLRQWEERAGVRLLRLPLYPDHSRSIVKRSANYLSFSASSMILGPFLSGSADVIWAYTALVGVPAVWLSALKRTPFVLEIADIWPETLIATGMFKEGLATRSLAALSGLVYDRAAALTVQSHGFKKNLVGKGVSASKIHVVENVADSRLYYPAPRDPILGRKYGLQGRFNVIFAGMMGAAQGLETIVEAAHGLADIPEIQFVLIGEGSCLEQAKKAARALSVKNLIFIPHQPASSMAGFFAYADALLVHLRRDPLFEITIPSKTQSYLACGRPIVMAVAGEGAELIEGASCGVTCPPGDPQALSAAVLKLYSLSPGQRETMGAAGLKLFQGRFGKELMVDKMERIFMEAAK